MKIALRWMVAPYFGWGVFGFNLALEWAADPSVEARSDLGVKLDGVDELRQRALAPFVARSQAAARDQAAVPLHAIGNGAKTALPIESHSAPGRVPKVGVMFFERPLAMAAVALLKEFDLIVVGSTFNERVLRAAGIANVCTVLQGVDPTLFHPAPRRGLFPGRLVIFSGGKAEGRKGQDIVAKAFRILARRDPSVMLVTAWRSPWPQLATHLDLDLAEFGDRVIEVGSMPNVLMPQILRECDLAVFPNRCEGGTNLAAMEAIACGLPTLLSDNSGHRDLLARGYGIALPQRPAPIEGWGETDPEELAAAIERLRRDLQTARPSGLERDLTWSKSAAALTAALRAAL